MTDKILPKNTAHALQRMVEITKDVILAFESETNTIALKKNIEFLEKTRQKQDINILYKNASKEFIGRQQEFVKLKNPLLVTLTALQKQLKQEIMINMNFLEPMRNKVKVDNLAKS